MIFSVNILLMFLANIAQAFAHLLALVITGSRQVGALLNTNLIIVCLIIISYN